MLLSAMGRLGEQESDVTDMRLKDDSEHHVEKQRGQSGGRVVLWEAAEAGPES